MPWPRFLIFNMLGAALWVGAWSSVGYFAGNHITPIYDQVSRYSLYAAIAAAVLVLILRAALRRRQAGARRSETPVESGR